VAWAINPHMRVGSVDGCRAVRQHSTLVEELRAAGALVEHVPFVHGAFDSVFAKDNAVIVERASGAVQALLAHPRHAERRAEQWARAEALGSLGVDVTSTGGEDLEGGDIVMLPRAAAAFLGHGFRSSTRAARHLERFIERDVTLIELCDPRLYHLDMALSVLDDGTLIKYEEALTTASLRAMGNHPAVDDVIRVPLEEALRFGVNLVQIGNTVVWGADAPRTARALRLRGLDLRGVDLDQFHLAGGSAACLVSRVHRQTLGMLELSRPPQSTAA